MKRRDFADETARPADPSLQQSREASDVVKESDEPSSAGPRQMPGLTRMGLNLAGSLGRAAASVVSGRNPIAQPLIAEARTQLCRTGACGRYSDADDRCYECGCYVTAKARLLTEACPRAVWGALQADTERPSPPKDSSESVSILHTEQDTTLLAEAGRRDLSASVTVMFFHHPACGACKLARETLDEARSHFGADAFNLVEIDATEFPAIAMEHGIKGFPTCLGYRDSDFAWRLEGAPSFAHLVKVVIDTAGSESAGPHLHTDGAVKEEPT